MVHYRIQVRTDTTGTVRYLTDTQSINQLLMSCQCTKINLCKGREKGDFVPHTQLGTESKGEEVSGFHLNDNKNYIPELYPDLNKNGPDPQHQFQTFFKTVS